MSKSRRGGSPDLLGSTFDPFMSPQRGVPAITDPAARVVFFPVRHHSPACARLLRAWALKARPAAILIEGPSDFNDRLGELFLPHRLPLAIYSYVRLSNGDRRGAFYPFCVHSPEWQALQLARELGAEAAFIDLPWADMATEEVPEHRYADDELRRSGYVETLCRKLGVDDFDSVWDTLFEIAPELSVADYLRRCHAFCLHLRLAEPGGREVDRRREAFMAAQVRRAMEQHRGRVLVVTGGFHSSALYSRVWRVPFPGHDQPETWTASSPRESEERGIALTPYSYERLDSLTGYEAGMPNPGFYHQVWEDRLAGEQLTHRTLLARVAQAMRQRKQTVSAADLIAVEVTACGLAALRGHAAVWRGDLVDAISGVLVKEETPEGGVHPFLEAVHQVLRGDRRGRVAEAAALPPLVHDLRRLLSEHDLEPAVQERTVDLDLRQPGDLARSRVLHRLRVLSIPHSQRVGGSDLALRDDLARVWERWALRWSPEFEAACIEAAIYGPTLAEAAAERLLERAARMERDAQQAALLLLDAALAGLKRPAPDFQWRLVELIRQDGDFFTVAGALGHLLYLYRYDEVLGTTGQVEIGAVLAEAFERGLWLLEGLGNVTSRERDFLAGMRSLLETFERCGGPLDLDREGFTGVLGRVGADTARSPLVCGAAVGALWSLGEAAGERVLADLRYFAAPTRLGDFLTGLFALAREAAQRQTGLVLSLDELLMGYDEEQFLEALPALRLAFSFFTPREKYYLARSLLEARGEAGEPLAALEVEPATAARALALEAALFRAVERYGLRRGAGRE